MHVQGNFTPLLQVYAGRIQAAVQHRGELFHYAAAYKINMGMEVRIYDQARYSRCNN